jgi:hypothetical protein
MPGHEVPVSHAADTGAVGLPTSLGVQIEEQCTVRTARWSNSARRCKSMTYPSVGVSGQNPKWPDTQVKLQHSRGVAASLPQGRQARQTATRSRFDGHEMSASRQQPRRLRD